MRIFLDIGAHVGETLYVVRKPKWNFDRIVCFEPASSCWSLLDSLASSQVEVCRYGLWRETKTLPLHNPGAVGASMSADKDAVDETIDCDFRSASEWFAENVRPEDEMYVKLNAEGAEADIIDCLSRSGQLGWIDHLLIHLDVRKVPSLRHREEVLIRQLAEAGVEYLSAEQIQFGVVGRGTENWLRWCRANPRTRDLRYKVLGRAIANARRWVYPLKKALLIRRVPVAQRGYRFSK